MAVVAASGCDDPVEPVEMDARQVLTTLYKETGGSRWSRSDNWATGAPLDTWFGVTTDSGGNVTGLRLPGNFLNGRIPPELGMLESLEHLDFGTYYANSNRLTGSIPPEFGNLQNIESLSLAGARLVTGSIPPELGSLRNLDFLNLEDNASMSGRLPRELIGVPLEAFRWNGTDMCAPRDDAFREWLASIRHHQGGRNCSSG